MDDNSWLSTITNNDKGSARGGWNGKTNKWEASVYPKGGTAETYTSISHRKVSQWLKERCKKHGIK